MNVPEFILGFLVGVSTAFVCLLGIVRWSLTTNKEDKDNE